MPNDEPSSSTFESVLERFETAWISGRRPILADYLFPAGHPERQQLLVELVHIDLSHRIRRGESDCRVEDNLSQFADELADDETLVSLIALEFEQRWRLVSGVRRAEYLDRFPSFAEALRSRLRTRWLCPVCRRECEVEDETVEIVQCPLCLKDYSLRRSWDAMATVVEPPSIATPDGLPNLDGYEILRELGRGGMGIVYEAHELALGRRRVAIKTLRTGAQVERTELERFENEVKAVAQLQHAGFVQI